MNKPLPQEGPDWRRTLVRIGIWFAFVAALAYAVSSGEFAVFQDDVHLALEPNRDSVSLAGKAPVIDGFSGDQRFFMSWAQVWRSLVTESEERRRLLSDPHSPGEFRVNGIVRNVDAWYDAFGVKPGDKLYLPPERRVKIW